MADQAAESFGEVALTYLDGLYSYAMSLSHNTAGAQDLVQQTCLRAMQASRHPVPGTNIKAWFYKILRNVYLNERRHENSSPFVELDPEPEENAIARAKSTDDPHLSYVAKIECRDVRAAVEGLAPKYREVIMLREFAELSYQEIADILGVPIGTVMSRLGRARGELRISLGQAGHA